MDIDSEIAKLLERINQFLEKLEAAEDSKESTTATMLAVNNFRKEILLIRDNIRQIYGHSVVECVEKDKENDLYNNVILEAKDNSDEDEKEFKMEHENDSIPTDSMNEEEPVTITIMKDLQEENMLMVPKKKKRKFQNCPLCNHKTKPSLLDIHLQEKHLDADGSYSCPESECVFTSPDVKVVVKHFDETHILKKSFICPHCSTSFEKVSSLISHLKEIHNESFDQNTCPICHIQLKPGYWVLPEHMKRLHDCSVHKCKICDKTIQNLSKYQYHMNYYHTEKTIFTCDECGFTTKLKDSFIEHVKSHSATEKNVQCPDCDKKFFSKKNMQKHRRYAHLTAENMYMCTECNFACKCKKSLQRHMTTHSDQRPFPCHLCELRFKDKGALRIHVKLHSQERKYVCNYCGKAFKSSTNQRTHERIHTGAKNSHCDICNKTFAQKGNYILHMMKTHQQNVS